MEDGQVVEERDTRLPRLPSPVSLMSQWSDSEELVEPVRQRGNIKNLKKRQTRIISLVSHNGQVQHWLVPADVERS